MDVTDRIKLAEELEAECRQCARESGWPDELLIGLVTAGIASAALKAGE